MKSVSEDIKDLLVAGGLGLTFGTNLFVSTLPDSPKNAVCLYDTSSSSADNFVSGDDPLYRDSVEVLVRDINFSNGFTLAQSIVELLNGKNNFTLNNSFYQLIFLSNGPNNIKNSGNRELDGGFFWSLNFNTIRTKTNNN